MAEILDPKSVEQELSDVSKVDDIEAGAHQAPLNQLTDTDFERLLWRIFEQQSPAGEYYDKATLMITGADRGRDVWLSCCARSLRRANSAASGVRCLSSARILSVASISKRARVVRISLTSVGVSVMLLDM